MTKFISALSLRAKNIAVECLDFIVDKLQIFRRSLLRSISPRIFEPLSPTESADDDNHYYNALEWALSNRKKECITNIAVTGPYGSGKSSVLKSFQKKYKKKDLRFLNISLATFKEEIEYSDPGADQNGSKQDSSKKKGSNQTELLRLIELSILQQIFYHEDDKAIPDSRFKKIRSFSNLRLALTSFLLLLFISAIANFLDPYFIQSALKDYPFSSKVCNIIHYGTYIVLVVGAFLILWRSIRIISSITINKLKIQSAEITVGDNVNKSIFNNHLDEIVYFFEVTPYNVVVIEDLDRFQQTEIFTKLREINLLLNNSEKTRKKSIVFIYAVRDDMFKDIERTKFFDFIVPVIPIINSSNSRDIILKKKVLHGYDLLDKLIEDISLFIADMRLLYNIMNEFYIYKQKLDVNLDHNKLLSIIVYKNLDPIDFTLLSKNKGSLFSFISTKHKILLKLISELDIQIGVMRDEIQKLESNKILDLAELRTLYVFAIIKAASDFQVFSFDYRTIITLDQILEDSYFEHLKNNRLKYRRPNHGASEFQLTSFSTIENTVNSKSYDERSAEIEMRNSGKVESLKEKIRELEVKKADLTNSKLKDLLTVDTGDSFNDVESNSVNADLIKLLLREGYIAEDYIDYISIFHEGSISRTDNQFLLCVRSQKKLTPEYPLDKIDKVVKRLSLADFEKEYSLNYDLADYLLSIEVCQETVVLFKKLSDASTSSWNFINGFIDRSKNLEKLIKLLCHYWGGFWKYVDASELPNERKRQYFKYIVEFSELKDLKLVASKSELKSNIESTPDFLGVIDNRKRLKDVIQSLNVEFKDLELNSSYKDVVDYIYENDFYALNVEMVQSMLRFYGKLNKATFDTQNYLCIISSGLNKLNARIEANIESYITDVFIKIPSNVEEQEVNLTKLLNKQISSDVLVKLVRHVETKVSLTLISDVEKKKHILKEGKVIAKWQNLLILFKDENKALVDYIVDYINIAENANELSKTKIPIEGDEKANYSDFWRKILLCDDLSDDVYEIILKSNPWLYPNLSCADLSYEKSKSLIQHKVLKLTVENYNVIKESFKELNVLFFEVNKSSFLEKVTDFAIDGEDLELLLDSKQFSPSEKSIIVAKLESVAVSHPKSLVLTARLVKDDVGFQISDLILRNVLLTSEVPIEHRVLVFNSKHSQTSEDLVTEFLNALGTPYSEITIKGRRPLLADKKYNLVLAQILMSKSYISSYSDEKGGIRISTFKPKTEEG